MTESGFPSGFFPDAPAEAAAAGSTVITDSTPAAEAALQTAVPVMMELLSAKFISFFPYGGDERRILAVITYLGPQEMDGISSGSRRPQYELLAQNDAAAGVTAAELDTGKSKFSIPPRIGRVAITVRPVKIVNQDKAMLLLRAW